MTSYDRTRRERATAETYRRSPFAIATLPLPTATLSGLTFTKALFIGLLLFGLFALVLV